MTVKAKVPADRSAALKKELDFYRKNLPEWAEHEGKYALIQDQTLVDFYSSYDDAIKIGYAKFGLDPFLVKRVQVVEQGQFVSRFVGPVPAAG